MTISAPLQSFEFQTSYPLFSNSIYCMTDFKVRYFPGQVILWAVRWYCKYGVSYHELAEMLEKRGINVNHSTIYRWVQKYALEIERRLRWYWKPVWASLW